MQAHIGSDREMVWVTIGNNFFVGMSLYPGQGVGM